MKCNKCGTPIIPGEDTCRICGNKTDFSKREKEPEIIDFPEDIVEPEETVEESSVEINEGADIAMELPDLDNIVNSVDFEMPVNNVSEDNVVVPVEESISQPVDNEILEEPLKETVEKPEEVVVKEEPAVEEEKELPKAKSEKKKKVKELKEKKPSFNFGLFLLVVLLLGSLAFNGYLYIMNSNAKAEGNDEPKIETVTYSKAIYSNYKITIPSTWIAEKNDKGLLIYDDTQDWSANIQAVDNSTYDTFVENKDKLVESLGTLKYQFTSNYSKEVDNKDYYLFKGKYYNYSVYVIVTALDKDTLSVIDLKFKGEVDDILLNNILTAIATVKENDTSELFKDNFEFSNINDKVSTISQS